MSTYLFYNPLAGNGHCLEDVQLLEVLIDDDVVFVDMTKPDGWDTIFFSMEPYDELILCGGDGTLNRFVNLVEEFDIPQEILYFPSGTGNDFAHDLGYRRNSNPFPVKEYIKQLPIVTVKGKKYRFLNGVEYGFDSYCCEVRDHLKVNTDKPVNYACIAVKRLLLRYKPTAATVTVDETIHRYKKVWIAPTMHGRCCGGGMMPTPEQSRTAEPRQLSVMVLHDSDKLKTLMMFPSIFKGEHIKYRKNVDVFSGKRITVEFDRPTALQIDGETILGVTSYTAEAYVREEARV